MKTIPLFLFAALLAGIGTVRADTIKLKDGSTMEGSILSETDQELVFEEENATGTIRTKRTVNKTDIAQVTRSSALEKAEKNAHWDLVELKNYQLNPQSSYPLAYYDKVISNSFLPFLTKYSNTTAAVTISKTLADWQGERAMVARGNIKYHGDWKPAEEVMALASRAQQEQLLQEGKSFAAQGRWDEAVKRLDALMIPNVPLEIVAEAKPLLKSAYEQYIAALELKNQQLTADIATARQQMQQAQQQADAASANVSHVLGAQSLSKSVDTNQGNNRRNYRDQRDRGGEMEVQRMGAYSGKSMDAQNQLSHAKAALVTAKDKLDQLNADQQTVSSKLTSVRVAATTFGIKETALASAAAVRTAVGPTAVASAKPLTEEEEAKKDVLESTGGWFRKNWILFAGGALVVLYMLSRFTRG